MNVSLYSSCASFERRTNSSNLMVDEDQIRASHGFGLKDFAICTRVRPSLLALPLPVVGSQNPCCVKNELAVVPTMTGDNFVERVHAYSKWLLGLESSGQEGEEATKEELPQALQVHITSSRPASGRPQGRVRG
jgi:hypothetical protein